MLEDISIGDLLVHHFCYAGLITVICYIVGKSIYNRYSHPLSAFDGPFLSSITEFYDLWLIYQRPSFETDEKLHEKYGPVFRKAPNILICNDASVGNHYSTSINSTSIHPSLSINYHDYAVGF
jgi:hypothetical protein